MTPGSPVVGPPVDPEMTPGSSAAGRPGDSRPPGPPLPGVLSVPRPAFAVSCGRPWLNCSRSAALPYGGLIVGSAPAPPGGPPCGALDEPGALGPNCGLKSALVGCMLL